MSNAGESPAFLAFRQNVGRMVHIFELLQEGINRASDELNNFNALPLTEDLDKNEQRVEHEKKLEERIDKVHAQMELITEWGCVFLVTCTETYLQDALSYFAGLDISLMNDSEQRASYKEVLSASSLDELAEELRGRWARNVIDGGGPSKWAERLKKMGASSLENFDLQLMEELWGSRHLIVHRAGKVTRDFLDRHPSCAKALGDQLVIPSDKLPKYIVSVGDFVKMVEGFLVSRYAGRSRKAPKQGETS